CTAARRGAALESCDDLCVEANNAVVPGPALDLDAPHEAYPAVEGREQSLQLGVAGKTCQAQMKLLIELENLVMLAPLVAAQRALPEVFQIGDGSIAGPAARQAKRAGLQLGTRLEQIEQLAAVDTADVEASIRDERTKPFARQTVQCGAAWRQ